MLPHGVINDDNKRRLASPWYYSICKAVTRGVFWVFEHPRNSREKLHTRKQITHLSLFMPGRALGADLRSGHLCENKALGTPQRLVPAITNIVWTMVGPWIHFYRAMLSIRGTSHGPVSVCVRHKSVFYRNR